MTKLKTKSSRGKQSSHSGGVSGGPLSWHSTIAEPGYDLCFPGLWWAALAKKSLVSDGVSDGMI
jgi:hypothetical protein